MTYNLYLLQYNNYFNRQLKILNSINDYLEYQIGDTLSNINFVPNDGLTTEQFINWNLALKQPDYLIVENSTEQTFSRWFIIESVRTRNGQYKISLKRDTLADYYDIINNSDLFIERGWLNNSDPFIFNSENQSYNQIKVSQTPLYDESKCPWIVGFIPRGEQLGEVETVAQIDSTDYTFSSLSAWKFNQYATKTSTKPSTMKTFKMVYI